MDNPFIGQINAFGFNFAPRGWSTCAGQLLPISQNAPLFSLLGTYYGGDGRSTFGLPDLRGRTAIGMGLAPGSNINWNMGTLYGYDQQSLTLSQLPAHDHNATFIPAANNGLTVEVNISTDDGLTPTPSAGAYLANVKAGGSGADRPELIYRGDAGSGTVPMGGVQISGNSGGTVQVQPAGNSQPFSVVQPSIGVNYSIALQGLYPSRN